LRHQHILLCRQHRFASCHNVDDNAAGSPQQAALALRSIIAEAEDDTGTQPQTVLPVTVAAAVQKIRLETIRSAALGEQQAIVRPQADVPLRASRVSLVCPTPRALRAKHREIYSVLGITNDSGVIDHVRTSLEGANFAVALSVNNWLGLVGDLGYYHQGNVAASGFSLTLQSYQFGPA